jgi:NADP-dependent 3-hydroxy acid dehydrogenase YdfG
LHYAAPGLVLGLIGRDSDRLEAVAALCRQCGAAVHLGAIDVRRRDELRAWIEAFDRGAPVDLVVANAGAMSGTPPGGEIEPADPAYALMETNVLGVLNTVQPLLPSMMARRRGQIALLSSIAAFAPVADAPSYAASKSAVMNYGLSLRALLASYGIGVSVIASGYVDTPMMHRESGKKPSVVNAEKAAAMMARGIARNRPLVVFPFVFGWATRLSGMLPDRMRRWIQRSFRFTVSD